jgi:hypothetical protein
LAASAELSKNVLGKVLQRNVPEGATLREYRRVASIDLGRPMQSSHKCRSQNLQLGELCSLVLVAGMYLRKFQRTFLERSSRGHIPEGSTLREYRDLAGL